MQQYTDRTDGSYVLVKESNLQWHYGDADREFGAMQAVELYKYLNDVVTSEVTVVHYGR
jgi:trehalose-6-phosphatase